MQRALTETFSYSHADRNFESTIQLSYGARTVVGWTDRRTDSDGKNQL